MAEFRFEQLDYPRMLYKGDTTKTVANAEEQAEAVDAGWALQPSAPQADTSAAAEPTADEQKNGRKKKKADEPKADETQGK